MNDDELRRARVVARDVSAWSKDSACIEAGELLNALADEVEDLRQSEKDCEQAIHTNGQLCDENAELKREREEVWKPLLEAVKKVAEDYTNLELYDRTIALNRAIARADEALKTEDRGT